MEAQCTVLLLAGLGGGRGALQDHCSSFGFGRRSSCACKLQVITLIRDVQTAFTLSHNSAPSEQGLSIYTHSPSLQLFFLPSWAAQGANSGQTKAEEPKFLRKLRKSAVE